MVAADKSPERSFDPELAWSTLERAAGLPESDRTSVLEDDSLDAGTRDFVAEILGRPSASATPAIRARYRLLNRLGEGGFGEVFLGRSMRPPKRLVAVKVLRSGMAGERILRRFESEQQALARLDHPAIAGIFESGTTDDGRPFFAMPLAIGEPVTAYAEHARLPIRQRVELFRTLVDAVAHAHRRGVLHRDLKPANVIVGTDDSGTAMSVIDFGIAKSLDEPLSEHTLVTEAGTVVGTPEYMSPEQADGLPEAADVRSDVYALGAILYELLSGQRPIDRETLRRGGLRRVGDTIRNTLVAPPSRRCALGGRTADARRLDGDLDAVCMKALAKDQADRYANADALLADLDRWLAGDPVLARTHSWRDNLRVVLRRHRTAVAVAASVALALAVGLASTAAFAVQAARESEARRTQADRAATLADFLAGIFGQLDPEQARGRDTTLLRIMLDDAAQELLDTERQLPPDVAAELHLVLGTAYIKLDELLQADRHLADALDAGGGGMPDGVRRDRALAAIFDLRYTQRRYDEAIEIMEERLRRHGWPRSPSDLEDPGILMDLARLASVGYRLDGERIAIPTTDPPPGASEEEILEARARSRQLVLADLRRYGDAAEAMLGPDDPRTLFVLAYVGRGFERSGERAEAIEVLEDALRRADESIGSRHAYTLRIVNYLSVAYGENERSLALILSRIDDVEALYGPRHPMRANFDLNSGWVLHRMERSHEAVEHLRRASRTYHETMGDHHELTVWADNTLLDVLKAIDAQDEAEAVLVARFEDWSRPDAPETGESEIEFLRGNLDWFETWTGRPLEVDPEVLSHYGLQG